MDKAKVLLQGGEGKGQGQDQVLLGVQDQGKVLLQGGEARARLSFTDGDQGQVLHHGGYHQGQVLQHGGNHQGQVLQHGDQGQVQQLGEMARARVKFYSVGKLDKGQVIQYGGEGQDRAKLYSMGERARAGPSSTVWTGPRPSSTAGGGPRQSSTAWRRGPEPEPRDSKERKEAWLHGYKDHIIKAKARTVCR